MGKYKVGDIYYSTGHGYDEIFIVEKIENNVYVNFIYSEDDRTHTNFSTDSLYCIHCKSICKLSKDKFSELIKRKELRNYIVKNTKLNRLLYPDRKVIGEYLIKRSSL